VKLLLDYGANPNTLIHYPDRDPDHPAHDRSLLTIAVFNGFADVARLLLKEGANPHPDGLPPLLAAFNFDYREVLAALLDGRPEDVLQEFDGRPFLVHAIEHQSSLLAVIARLVEAEVGKQSPDQAVSFPPRSLNRKQKKDLKRAMKLHDDVLSTEAASKAVRAVKRPWKKPSGLQLELEPIEAPPARVSRPSPPVAAPAPAVPEVPETPPEDEATSGQEPEEDEPVAMVVPVLAAGRAPAAAEEEEDMSGLGSPPRPPAKKSAPPPPEVGPLPEDSYSDDSNPY
jgi:hypothetical protein